MSSLTIEQTLTAARNGVTKSRAASQRAKTFLDSGHPHRLEREIAIEELRISVEQVIDVLKRMTNEDEEPEEHLLAKEVVPEIDGGES